MISFMRNGGAATTDAPLHKLTQTQTLAWITSTELRRSLASSLVRHYQGGCGVVSATMRLFAYVAPNGAVQELAPPHRAVERWHIANQPKPVECQCAGFYDPESQGPWRNRGGDDHHPLCQYDPKVTKTFALALRKDELPEKLAKRPDLWVKLRAHGQ